MPPVATRVLLTGEYPPQRGGVADYARQVAAALAGAGEQVHVFAPACGQPGNLDRGVTVHRLERGFAPMSLLRLGRAIASLPQPRRILVQYVPQSFGARGMNVPFCAWLRAWRRDPIDVMFHEVAFPLLRRQHLRHSVISLVQRTMARMLSAAADRVLVSTEAWIPLLRSLGVSAPATWLPVPSNLPIDVDRTQVAAFRSQLDPACNKQIVGHFGTFGEPVGGLVAGILAAILEAGTERIALLVGRGSRAFAADLVAARPGLKGRVEASGGLDGDSAAIRLAACDLLVQPFPDGVTTRRGSFMAGLALGVPVVSNQGPLMEPFWRDIEGITLAPSPAGIVGVAEALLADDGRRRRAGAVGAEVYRARFALARSIEVLRNPDTVST